MGSVTAFCRLHPTRRLMFDLPLANNTFSSQEFQFWAETPRHRRWWSCIIWKPSRRKAVHKVLPPRSLKLLCFLPPQDEWSNRYFHFLTCLLSFQSINVCPGNKSLSLWLATKELLECQIPKLQHGETHYSWFIQEWLGYTERIHIGQIHRNLIRKPWY